MPCFGRRHAHGRRYAEQISDIEQSMHLYVYVCIHTNLHVEGKHTFLTSRAIIIIVVRWSVSSFIYLLVDQLISLIWLDIVMVFYIDF